MVSVGAEMQTAELMMLLSACAAASFGVRLEAVGTAIQSPKRQEIALVILRVPRESQARSTFLQRGS